MAEKSGLVKRFDALSDTTPDRGRRPPRRRLQLLGPRAARLGAQSGLRHGPHDLCALHPRRPSGSQLAALADGRPTDQRRPVSRHSRRHGGRLCGHRAPAPPRHRHGDAPKTAADGSPLITDWCQQYPSHSVGSLQFGADGFLYASGGDGANFNFADYGQYGSPLNPCGDPPGPRRNGADAPERGRRGPAKPGPAYHGDPLGLDGTVIRIDPVTGAGAPGNPLAGSADANARRVVAHGMRNPFRISFRPGTSDLCRRRRVGDLGGDQQDPEPCGDAVGTSAGPATRAVRDSPASTPRPGGLREPVPRGGRRGHRTVPLRTSTRTRSPSATDARPVVLDLRAGVLQGGTYPAQYDGALFFTDYTRRCLWSMRPNAQGVPDPSTPDFLALPGGAVNLEIGPAGDLFYADFDNGTIRRIAYSMANQPPTARSRRTRPVATSP